MLTINNPEIIHTRTNSLDARVARGLTILPAWHPHKYGQAHHTRKQSLTLTNSCWCAAQRLEASARHLLIARVASGLAILPAGSRIRHQIRRTSLGRVKASALKLEPRRVISIRVAITQAVPFTAYKDIKIISGI